MHVMGLYSPLLPVETHRQELVQVQLLARPCLVRAKLYVLYRRTKMALPTW